jgi:site-specific DNA-methyltransferase (adenine-specific)
VSDHELRLGDCLGPDGLATLADKSVNVTITDPPFDKKTHSRGGAAVKRYDGGPAIPVIPFAPLDAAAPIAKEIARVTQRWALVFCAVRQIEEWSTAFEAEGWNIPRVLVWVKPDASPQFSGDRPGHGYEVIVLAHPVGRTRWNGGGMKGVYECMRIDRDSGWLHPTQKPILLMERLIADFTDMGELVLDPFAGSGTTACAAKRLCRRSIGFEIDPQFHAAAVKRLDATREQLGLLPRQPKPKQAAFDMDPEAA